MNQNVNIRIHELRRILLLWKLLSPTKKEEIQIYAYGKLTLNAL